MTILREPVRNKGKSFSSNVLIPACRHPFLSYIRLTVTMKMKNLSILVFLLVGIGFSACRKAPAGEGPDRSSVEFLRSSPEKIPLDSFSLVLDPYVWRSYMIGDPDNKLRNSIQLVDKNKKDIRSRLQLVGQTVLRGDERWECALEDQGINQRSILHSNASDGPLWEPGDTVDVICHFKDNLTGIQYNIISKKEKIHKVG